MMKNKKKNNKGFSLVELIVVMAIMAILAVTLAPRLLNYVDKARQANDREVINNIYTATQYALVDDTIYAAAIDTSLSSSTTFPRVISLGVGKDGSASSTDDQAYKVTGGKNWEVNKDASNTVKGNKFIYELTDVMKNFKLQSNKVGSDARIIITITGTSTNLTSFTVQLDYENDGTYDYTLDSTNAS